MAQIPQFWCFNSVVVVTLFGIRDIAPSLQDYRDISALDHSSHSLISTIQPRLVFLLAKIVDSSTAERSNADVPSPIQT